MTALPPALMVPWILWKQWMFPRCSHCTSTRLQLLCYILEAASRAKWDRFKDAVEILGVASFLHHNVTLQECLRAVFFKCLLFSSCLFSPVFLFLHFHLATPLWRKLSVKKGINSALLTAWPFKFQKYCRNIPLCNAVPLKVNDSTPSIHPFQSFAWQRSKWRKVCICKLNSLSSRELKGLIIFQATGANK